MFIRDKSDTFEQFKTFSLKIQNQQGVEKAKVSRIRSEHGREFGNALFEEFYDSLKIAHKFFAPKTPQQTGVVKRKNRTIQEIARVMLHDKNIPM